MNRIDLSGQIFGRLTVIRLHGSRKYKRLWECLCQCGNVSIVSTSDLTTGHSKTCGCRIGRRTRTPSNIEDRFWRKVQKTDGCWNWIGSFNRFGYGVFARSHKKQERAHRISMEIHGHTIPEGMHVCHKCDNRKCVNPDHLFIGTCSENIHDMVIKGRQVKGSKCHSSVLKECGVSTLRSLFYAGVPTGQLSKMYGVRRVNVNKIISNKMWKSVSGGLKTLDRTAWILQKYKANPLHA